MMRALNLYDAKTHLSTLVEEAAAGAEIIISKNGRPVARVVPIEDGDAAPMLGSVRLIAEEDAAYYSTGESWEAEPDRS